MIFIFMLFIFTITLLFLVIQSFKNIIYRFIEKKIKFYFIHFFVILAIILTKNQLLFINYSK